MKLDIRRATVADVEALVTLRIRLLREMGDLPADQDAAALAQAIERYLTDHLRDQTFVAWVAEEERTIVGTGGLVFMHHPPSHHSPAGFDAYLMNMYTVPERRGTGVASAILRAMVEFVRTTLARRIWLHATEAGAPVYARHGFRRQQNVMQLTW